LLLRDWRLWLVSTLALEASVAIFGRPWMMLFCFVPAVVTQQLHLNRQGGVLDNIRTGKLRRSKPGSDGLQ